MQAPNSQTSYIVAGKTIARVSNLIDRQRWNVVKVILFVLFVLSQTECVCSRSDEIFTYFRRRAGLRRAWTARLCSH